VCVYCIYIYIYIYLVHARHDYIASATTILASRVGHRGCCVVAGVCASVKVENMITLSGRVSFRHRDGGVCMCV